MTKLEEIYKQECETPSDINEHLPILKKYGSECSTILEFGTRAVVSTWAFLASLPKKLISVDLNFHKNIEDIKKIATSVGVDFEFIQNDDTLITPINTDLLFIDTWHCYSHMKKELLIHGNYSQKYIICHDTVSCGTYGMPTPSLSPDKETKGILPAIKEWLLINPQWVIKEHFMNNNGLLIIERKIDNS
jgi:predicted O-methyltransferase YrrM